MQWVTKEDPDIHCLDLVKQIQYLGWTNFTILLHSYKSSGLLHSVPVCWGHTGRTLLTKLLKVRKPEVEIGTIGNTYHQPTKILSVVILQHKCHLQAHGGNTLTFRD